MDSIPNRKNVIESHSCVNNKNLKPSSNSKYEMEMSQTFLHEVLYTVRKELFKVRITFILRGFHIMLK